MMRPTYYNEIDADCCRWLRNLIDAGELPAGHIDNRSITDVTIADLAGFGACHFFAGCGGWPVACRISGIPVGYPIWTGSCPCQPFSCAGSGKGQADERHLWPAFARLIRECRPDRIVGEQVAAAIGHGWLDGVACEVESIGYAFGTAVLGAGSVGAPHIRKRLYWVADRIGSGCEGADRAGQPGETEGAWTRTLNSERGSFETTGGIGCSTTSGLPERGAESGTPDRRDSAEGPGVTLGDACITRLQGHAEHGDQQGRPQPGGPATTAGAWDHYTILHFTDGKARRAEPGSPPLVAGFPRRMGRQLTGLSAVDHRAAVRNRKIRLMGYGNALCVPTAVAFLQALDWGRPSHRQKVDN